MLPARRFNQFGLTDFFNDFFENRSLEKVEFTTPAINVKENDHGYKIELAVPGMTKDDFKIHINKDGNLVIEMEKKEKDEKKECEEGKCCEAKNVRYIRREFSCSKFRQRELPLLLEQENLRQFFQPLFLLQLAQEREQEFAVHFLLQELPQALTSPEIR